MNKMKAIRNVIDGQKQNFPLTILLTVIVFIILTVAIGLAALIVYILVTLGVFGGTAEEIELGAVLAIMSLISLFIGSTTTILLGKFPLKPINKLVDGMKSLASGKFDTRIEYRGSIANHPTFSEITKSFNTLAEELGKTEMLRSDFINNFSHEFKTPIVSISGFAKLLLRGNLSEEQREQYLKAIDEESMRLSYMATNVLNMTKIENQAILTDISSFNLSEQIRSAVLILEGKWSKRDIEFQLDFDEYTVMANEELLKEVWINLIDNAIKFSPRGEKVKVDITDMNEKIRVSISNIGKGIPQHKLEKIWGKFYQADESHHREGNGIGLAIVKRIVELHKGEAFVSSKDGITTFTVDIPKAQI